MESAELIFWIVLGLPPAFAAGWLLSGARGGGRALQKRAAAEKQAAEEAAARAEAEKAAADKARAFAEGESARLKQEKAEQKDLSEKERTEHRKALQQKDETVQNLIKELTQEKADRENAQKDLENKKEELNLRENLIEETRKKMVSDIQNTHDKLVSELKDRSRALIDKGTETYKKQSKESLNALLDPLKGKIDDFKKQVSDLDREAGKERRSLQDTVKSFEAAQKTSAEQTEKLARALKGSAKVQGDWGERILERILEFAGLQEGHEFTRQGKGLNMKTEEGKRLKPDITVHLPDNQDLVIDAKTSLAPYQDYLQAESESEKERRAQNIVQSLERHVQELSAKDYVKNYPAAADRRPLNFAFMFVPSDGIFSAAIQCDPSFWEKAWKKDVMIVTPLTLLAALKIVDSLWRLEKQNKNARKIARQSGKMYDKFAGFLKDMEQIGKGLDNARSSYEGAVNKLQTGSGNLITRSKKIKSLAPSQEARIEEGGARRGGAARQAVPNKSALSGKALVPPPAKQAPEDPSAATNSEEDNSLIADAETIKAFGAETSKKLPEEISRNDDDERDAVVDDAAKRLEISREDSQLY